MHRELRSLIEEGAELAITEVVVMELLAGAPAGSVRRLRGRLLAFEMLALRGLADFEAAARLYRTCRRGGRTPRALTDCLVAVPALREEASILHKDRDFGIIAEHSDLQIRNPRPAH